MLSWGLLNNLFSFSSRETLLRRCVERRGHDGDAVGQRRELRRVGRRREEPCDDVLGDADQRVEERKDSHVVCLAASFVLLLCVSLYRTIAALKSTRRQQKARARANKEKKHDEQAGEVAWNKRKKKSRNQKCK